MRGRIPLPAIGVTLMLGLAASIARGGLGGPVEVVTAEARKAFGDSLTDADLRFFEAMVLGEVATPERLGGVARLRADRIAWLCSTPGVAALVTHRGVRLERVDLEDGGKLDLANVKVAFPLSITAAKVPSGIDLGGAEVRSLCLDRSKIGDLFGRSMKVDLDIRMRSGFEAGGVVDLSNARIGGDLDLLGASLLANPSLHGDYLSVGRDLILRSDCDDGRVRHRFRATGQVRLAGSTINGVVNCDGGWFADVSKAIDAAGMVVKGNARFTSVVKYVGTRMEPVAPLEAEGVIELSNARIGGDLHCAGGRFRGGNGESGNAIRAHGLEVGGDVHFDQGFASLGRVDLTAAKIGGSLECTYGTFSPPGRVRGGGPEDVDVAIDVKAATVGHDVLLGKRFAADGLVRLEGASIAGDLDCDGGHFANPGGAAIEARSVAVKGSVRLGRLEEKDREARPRDNYDNTFDAIGAVLVTRARIGGDLDCGGGRFLPGRDHDLVLDVSGTVIEGSLRWDDRFEPRGVVRAFDARINRFLRIAGIPEPARGEMILDLGSARVGVLDHDAGSWPGRSRLVINGFTYESLATRTLIGGRTWLDWLNLNRDFASGPYEQLAAVLLRTGFADDARKVLIEKERRKGEELMARGPSIWDWAWYRLLGPIIGYGFAPLNTFGFALGFIALGWVVFGLAYRWSIFVPKAGGEGGPDRQFLPWLYSIDLFMPVISLHEQDQWLLAPDRRAGRKFWTSLFFRLYWMFHIVMGWLITSLLVAGLLGLIHHD